MDIECTNETAPFVDGGLVTSILTKGGFFSLCYLFTDENARSSGGDEAFPDKRQRSPL